MNRRQNPPKRVAWARIGDGAITDDLRELHPLDDVETTLHGLGRRWDPPTRVSCISAEADDSLT